MSNILRSRRLSRAVIGISIVAFSILALFQFSVHPSDGDRLSPSSALESINSVDVISHSIDNVSAQTRQLLPRVLPKRVTLTMDAAVCQGEFNVEQMTQPGNHKDANTAPQDLDGWSVGASWEQDLSFEFVSGFRTLIPGSHGKVRWVQAEQDETYHDIHNVQRVCANFIVVNGRSIHQLLLVLELGVVVLHSILNQAT